MRHRLTIILGLALALVMATGALAGTVGETLVEGGAGNQFSGDGNTTYLTWAASSTRTAPTPRRGPSAASRSRAS